MALQEECQLAAPLPGAVRETFAGEGEHRDKEFLPLSGNYCSPWLGVMRRPGSEILTR